MGVPAMATDAAHSSGDGGGRGRGGHAGASGCASDRRQARRVIRQRVRSATGGVVLAALLAVAAWSAVTQWSPTLATSMARQLAESGESSTSEDECGVMADWERQGGIVVYILLLLYVFVALAIVCDDYFVSSLEKITDALELSQDVAGATFMAAGSSAPELFVSLADNVFAEPKESLGIGTIVGSAIFNVLIIIALSAMLAGQVLTLDWRPLMRDTLWYCYSIILLTLVISDGSVDVYESAGLFGSYVLYCLYMSQNERIVRLICQRPEDAALEKEAAAELDAAAERAAQLVDRSSNSSSAASSQNILPRATSSSSSGAAAMAGEKRAWTIDVERVDSSMSESRSSQVSVDSAAAGATRPSHPHRLGSQSKLNPMFRSKYRMFQYHPSMQDRNSSGSVLDRVSMTEGATASDKPASLRDLQLTGVTDTASASSSHSIARKGIAEGNEDEGDEQEVLGGYFDEVFDVPAGVLPKVWFFISRPIVVAMRLTIPDCRYPRFSGPAGYISSFVLSIVWIALLSHFTVIWATKFGCLAGIPSALMGLTIIAAGTSIPDALSSVLVARDGQGDMAVSNAIGSNVFDVLLGLGLPFFLSNLVYGAPVAVVSDDLELSIFILFGVIITVVVLLCASRWRLYPAVGAFMALLYAVYVVFSYVRGIKETS